MVSLGETDPDHLHPCDYAIGIPLRDKAGSGQSQALNTILTTAQNRYLLNAQTVAGGGYNGYLNIRLTSSEFEIIRRVAPGRGTFREPFELVRPDAGREGAVRLTRFACVNRTINEGLKLFGIPPEAAGGVMAFELKPRYLTRFTWRRNNRVFAAIGDAAISHHFWPGRGLNTGLQGVAALSRAVRNCVGHPSNSIFQLL